MKELIAQGPVDVNVRGWMPIETAPKNGFSRLYRINGFCVQGFIDATGALMVQSEIDPHWRMARGKPTHWMPLPDAPNALGNRRAAFGASVLTDGLAGKRTE